MNELIKYLIIFVMIYGVSYILYKYAIPILYRLKFGQVIREEGIEEHKKKSGTPTMGGIIFIIVSVFSFLIYITIDNSLNNYIHIIICMLLFGIVGFVDDYLKIVYKNPKGLDSRIKFISQICISLIFIYFNFISGHKLNEMKFMIPFTNNIIDMSVDMFFRISFVVIVVLYITAVNNGVNFSDGLDGLCASITIIISIMFIILSKKMLTGQKEDNLIVLNILVLSTISAFLAYNKYPAKVFMGDTGSLFIGSYVAFMALLLDIELYIFIFGIIYFIEVLSVIIQVTYFKKTGGKRFFKMAPIHHHFEKCGMKEQQIVVMFSFITLIACLITYRALILK